MTPFRLSAGWPIGAQRRPERLDAGWHALDQGKVTVEFGAGWKTTHCVDGVRLTSGELSIHLLSLDRGVVVERGPAASEQCYYSYSASDGSLRMFSDLTTAGDWAGGRRVDTAMIGLGLLYRDNRARRTAIEGVHELRVGERLIFRGGFPTISASWSPWDYVRSADEPIDTLCADLRNAVLKSVGDLVEDNGHIVVEMSGGLDSSILACALSQIGADFSMVLYVPFGPEGDERRFAQKVADHVGRPLHIQFPDSAYIDVTISNAAHSPRPSTRSFTQEFDRLAGQIADTTGATCIVNGGGGDAVFGAFRSASPVVDRLLLSGFRLGVFRTVRDVAQICEVGTGTVLSKARTLSKTPPGTRWATHPEFLAMEFVEAHGLPPSQPWLEDERAKLPGLRYLLTGVLSTLNYLEGSRRAVSPGLAFPLLSRPVLEAAIGIPTWRNCEGGISRSVARRAFSDMLPGDIAARRGKGAFDGLTFDIFHRHRSMIREMLLNGRLSADGVADRQAIERFFASERLPNDLELIRLLALADCEAWISSVEGDAPSAELRGRRSL